MTISHDEGALAWTGERYIPEISGNIRLEHLHRYLLARELARSASVLDIACGEGYGSDLLATVAARVVGVDIAPDVVQHARRRYRRENLSFIAGTCAAIPVADNSVDVVVSFETLEHHDQHDEMMREVRRVLRPGGLLVISSPDRAQYSDLPGYNNPFHVRELYRDEFRTLLQSHFAHVDLVGQRIRAGSLIAPVDTPPKSQFLSFGEKEGRRTEGLDAPMYFIGLATNGPMPVIPTGLLDGGEFVWPTDHVQAVQAVQEQHAIEVRQFSQVRAAQDATVTTLRGELERQMSTITALSVEIGRAEEHRRRLDAQLGEVRNQLVLQTAMADSLDAERHVLEHRVQEQREHVHDLNLQISRLMRDRESLAAAIAQRAAAHRALEDRLTAIERSHSWRLTSPIRAARRVVGAAPRRARQAVSDSIREIYRHFPLPFGVKRRVKGTVFRVAPPLVRHTAAYRAWQEFHRPPAPPPVETASGHPEASAAGAVGQAAVETALVPLKVKRFGEAHIDYVPLMASPGVDTRIKAIAFYLPQFHPIPENDTWWGRGFTEWNNVARGRPQFPGHYQPHLPDELGFYDLRLLEVQRRQAELAKMYGLHGFCYHHYWFSGKRLLRRPLDQVLANPDIDFPFCLCWANENWTRRWDGLDGEILVGQEHSPEDDLAFIRDLEPALRDPRYIRVDGRPLLIVYRPTLLPDPRATADRWRTYCQRAGLPDLFLVSAQGFDRCNPLGLGFDAAVEFAPNNMGAPPITTEVEGIHPEFAGTVYDYAYLVEYSRRYQRPIDHLLFRSVAPMWDNEARRPGRGTVFAGSTPELYREWLENACQYTLDQIGPDKPFVFVNAWNEWAEGAHLEPDRAHGYAYLQATADALRKFPSRQARPQIVVVSHDAYFHGAQRVALGITETLAGSLGYDVHVLLCGEGPLTRRFAQSGRVHDFSPSTSTVESRTRIVRNLYESGARIALCNTSVVGDAVARLKSAGFTVVSMIHELPGLIANYGLESSIATITREADRVVFPAAVVRDRFTELTNLSPEKAVVRPQGLLTPNRYSGRRTEARLALRAALGLNEDVRIVLAVGYADRRKGIDLFVEAGLTIVSQIDDVRFVWVGHHDLQPFAEARARIDEAGAGSRFLFPGLVENAELYFAGSDVYLMTSREDPFPLVVLDALDAELPTVGFEGAGGFVELLRRNCGILVPHLDTRAMADAVRRLLDNPSEGRQLTAAGKAIITKEFSFADYTRDLVRLGEGPRPRISVIVPNYNYERYLRDRLQSILAQTFRPHEIIFLDDCSSDRSVEAAEELLQDSGIPFRIIRNSANQGVYRQWLHGLREATGDLVWIAEADDDCAPTLLETLAPAFEEPGVVLAYCQSKQIDEHGRTLAPDYLEWTADVDPLKWRDGYVRRGVDEIRDSLIVKNTIPNVSAVLMRKPDLSSLESQLLALKNAGDWLVYVHLLERGDVAFVPAAHNAHRRHGGSVTLGHGGLNLMREILLVQRHILDRHPVASEVELKREQHLQATYEYLGLHVDGPASYKDHQALSSLAALTR